MSSISVLGRVIRSAKLSVLRRPVGNFTSLIVKRTRDFYSLRMFSNGLEVTNKDVLDIMKEIQRQNTDRIESEEKERKKVQKPLEPSESVLRKYAEDIHLWSELKRNLEEQTK